MKRRLLMIMFLSFMGLSAESLAKEEAVKKYTKVPSGFLMVLTEGDDLFKSLEDFAEREKLPSATLTGMGFVNATFGYFNFEKKEYEPKEFKKVELASLTGSIAWQDGKPSLHLHGLVTGKDFQAYGGHLLKAQVSTGSLEIIILVHDKKLTRIKDEKLGANILQLKE